MKNVLAILKLLPELLAAIRAVEEAIPLPGQGRKKLEFILDIMKLVHEASAEISREVTWDRLVALIVPVITRVVGFYNEVGIFTKSSAAKSA